MQTWRKALLEDPSLLAMGLVPARNGAGDVRANGTASSWRSAWLAVGLGVALLLALFWPIVVRTVETWFESATFNHGILIGPICAWLLWTRREAIADLVPRPTWWGVAAMPVIGLGWLLGHLASVASVQQFALVGMIDALFLAIFGVAIFRKLAFPLFYLIFAVPFGQVLIPPLQDVTAHFVVKGMRLIDVPIYLDGVFLYIPTGAFEVAEACSGLRFLIASIALGCLFAHLTYRSWTRRLLFVGLSMVVPVVANGFRAFGIVLLAYVSSNKLATGVDHIVYGWIFFAFVTFLLLALGSTFREAPQTSRADCGATGRTASPAASCGQVRFVAVAALAAALVMPAYARLIDSRPPAASAASLSAPNLGGGWVAVDPAFVAWSPVFVKPDAILQRTYSKDGRAVKLFMAYYGRQNRDAEAIGGGNRVADGRLWIRTQIGFVTAHIDGRPRKLRMMRMLHGQKGLVAFRWYWVDGYQTANPYIAKAVQAFDRVLGGRAPTGVIVVGAPYGERPAEAVATLKDFLRSAKGFRGAFARAGAAD